MRPGLAGFIRKRGIYDPSSRTDKYARHRADVVSLSGSIITGVTDQWGTNDVIQSAGHNPLLVSSAFNGKPAADLSGSAYFSKNSATFTLAQGFTAYVIGTTPNAAANHGLFDSMSGTNRCAAYANTTACHQFSADGTGNLDISGTKDPSSLRVWCVVFNGASSALYVDNMTTAIATGTMKSPSLVTIVLGALSGGSNLSQGLFAEWLFFTTAHSASDRHNIAVGYANPYYAATAS